jgi:hypothetical protein
VDPVRWKYGEIAITVSGQWPGAGTGASPSGDMPTRRQVRAAMHECAVLVRSIVAASLDELEVMAGHSGGKPDKRRKIVSGQHAANDYRLSVSMEVTCQAAGIDDVLFATVCSRLHVRTRAATLPLLELDDPYAQRDDLQYELKIEIDAALGKLPLGWGSRRA